MFHLQLLLDIVFFHCFCQCHLSFFQGKDTIVTTHIGPIVLRFLSNILSQLECLWVNLSLGINKFLYADVPLFIRTSHQQRFVLCQQQDMPFVVALYFDDLQILGILFQFVVNGMKMERARIKGIEFPVNRFQP